MQKHTKVFRKKELTLGSTPYTHETILNYTGGLHSHLKHAILMCSPSKCDEVCVKETHIEVGGSDIGASWVLSQSCINQKYFLLVFHAHCLWNGPHCLSSFFPHS